jgi:hypothetical protein
MNFKDLHEQIKSNGFTALSNPLEDLLLRELPDEYYRFWRYVWRRTVGWNKIEDDISMRQIATGAHIHISAASRAAWFFHTVQMIKYTPGAKKQAMSRIRILPCVEPSFIAGLAKMLDALHQVLRNEKQQRRGDKDFRYTNEEFCSALANRWIESGGQVIEPQQHVGACA